MLEHLYETAAVLEEAQGRRYLDAMLPYALDFKYSEPNGGVSNGPDDPDDSALMAELAGGVDLALNALMDRWASKLTAFLVKMTGNREVAIDLCQETFVRLYNARKCHRPRGAFSTYLFSIAANLARNHARWKRRHPAVSLDATTDDGRSLVPESRDPRPGPDEYAGRSERYREVHDALLALPHDLREAISLFVYDGMGYAEIASVADCSPKAVETRIYRARQILKERLNHLRT
jgi:RNA polymerase sigma-70 factor (ECF subfamily)